MTGLRMSWNLLHGSGFCCFQTIDLLFIFADGGDEVVANLVALWHLNKFGVIGLLQFYKGILPSHVTEFHSQKLRNV